MKSLFKILTALFFLVFSSQTFAAWDGSATGTISRIEVTDGNNYGFRILLDGNPKLCGNEHNWAYINESDSNYNTFVSVLIAAKAGKQRVRVFTKRKDGAADGYCHIGYVYLL